MEFPLYFDFNPFTASIKSLFSVGESVDIFNSDDPRDIQILNDAMSKFSHRQFRDRYGNLLPLGATQLLNLWPFAGASKYCHKCQSEFGDYYRLYLHYSETRHSRPSDLERKLNELRLIERDYY